MADFFVKYLLHRHLQEYLSDFCDSKCILQHFLMHLEPISTNKAGGIKLMQQKSFVKSRQIMIENRSSACNDRLICLKGRGILHNHNSGNNCGP